MHAGETDTVRQPELFKWDKDARCRANHSPIGLSEKFRLMTLNRESSFPE
jgi:hypothetical protein